MATVQANALQKTKVTVFTGTGTFTPDPRALSTLVQLQAAGGTSSGYNGGSAKVGSSGGGGGNYMEVLIQSSLTAAVTVTLGQPNAGTNALASNAPNSSFGTYIVAAGGARGYIYSTGSSEAVIGAAQPTLASSTAFGTITATTIVDMPGGQGGGIWMPRTADFNFIKGGDGGHSYWGRGGVSEAAIYSGAGGYASVQRNGSGWGWGAQGFAHGSVANIGGYTGGPPRCVITEYF